MCCNCISSADAIRDFQALVFMVHSVDKWTLEPNIFFSRVVRTDLQELRAT